MNKYKKMYNSAFWKTTRKVVLAKKPFCVFCLKEQKLTIATEIDHIIPHKGDWNLFNDFNNLQPLCKYHHGLKSQKEK